MIHVHIGGIKMNHAATSKDALLHAGLRLVSEKGLQALNMREISKACGISVGCVYHYFSSKADLMIAIVEKIWQKIFDKSDGETPDEDFRAYVRWVFACMAHGLKEYPSFLSLHALVLQPESRAEGRAAMKACMAHVMEGMLSALRADGLVRREVFDAGFEEEAFVEFIFQNLLALSQQQADSCAYLITLIEKILY